MLKPQVLKTYWVTTTHIKKNPDKPRYGCTMLGGVETGQSAYEMQKLVLWSLAFMFKMPKEVTLVPDHEVCLTL